MWSTERQPDYHIIRLVNQVKPAIEAREEKEFHLFEPVSYICQDVYGTNYWIKVRYDDGYTHIKIFKPRIGHPPFLRQYEKGKDIDDNLAPFYQNRP